MRNRRVREFWVLALLLSACASPMEGAEQAPVDDPATPPPNIVVFLVDDMGWQDTSVPFHTEVTELNRRYRTPNMERLAAEGMVFTQGYAHAICSPTRVSLMTGQSPVRHCVTNWTLHRNGSNDRHHPVLDPVDWNVNGLSPEPGIEGTVHARALPEELKAGGYHTIHAGKAHFGAIDTPGADPRNLGFDVNIAGHAAGGPGSFYGLDHFSATRRTVNPSPDTVWDVPGLEKYHGQDIYLTQATTIEALSATEAAIDREVPFFLYLAHYAVHAPLMPDPRFVGNYPDLDPREAAYASMIEGMDESLGEVLDLLERRGVRDETVVLFLSDNGGLSHAARGGERFTHNAPLSAGKGSAHEGGIRVPWIMSWPGVTPKGSRCHHPVIVEDVRATLLEVSRLDDQPMIFPNDGRSFVQLLRDPDGPPPERWHPLLWHVPNNWTGDFSPGYGPHSTIRVGDWKLIYYHNPERAERFELFHLGRDIGEQHNLVDSEPERFEEMVRRLSDALWDRHGQLPTVRETGDRIETPINAWDSLETH